ncbi:MAG TPA: hypothetical protein VHP34_11890 [Alphaproteobacteria bacterium]|nr:hypothetical protein [Alphaproteobacteria bacterium]
MHSVSQRHPLWSGVKTAITGDDGAFGLGGGVGREIGDSFAKVVYRANALASLENINRAIIKRRLKGPGF